MPDHAPSDKPAAKPLLFAHVLHGSAGSDSCLPLHFIGRLPAAPAPLHVLSLTHQACFSGLHNLHFTGDETQDSLGISVALHWIVFSNPDVLRHQSTY